MNDILSKAKVQLLLHHPFFATILLKRPLQITPEIKTACTDGLTIWANPIFFEKLTVREGVFVLCHEVLHIAFLHHVRIGNRNAEKWNYACDYAINAILLKSGLSLPKGGLYDPQYEGLSAEVIYDRLPENYKQTAKGYNPKGDSEVPIVLIGDFKSPGLPDKQSIDEHILRVTLDVHEAAQVAKARGQVPSGIDRLIYELENSAMDWRSILSSYLTQCAMSDYSYRKLNSGYLQRGFFVPTLHTPDKGKFIIAADTSASVYNEMLKDFMSHASSILELSSDILTVLYCDAAIAGVQEVDPNNPEPLKIKGNGGTDFKPVGKWIEENEANPEVLIYFTDGECNSFPDEPPYQVIWATNDPSFNPPYGINLVVSSHR